MICRYRFDIRYIIAALNFICIELINAGHYLNTIPSITLYEYFSRNLARDLNHTVLARILKIEALVKLNMFSRAIQNMNQLCRGDRLPHFIDEKFRLISLSSNKYVSFIGYVLNQGLFYLIIYILDWIYLERLEANLWS